MKDRGGWYLIHLQTAQYHSVPDTNLASTYLYL